MSAKRSMKALRWGYDDIDMTCYDVCLDDNMKIGATTPKKARKFKKPASPSKKKILVIIKEPAKKPAKKPTARR
ncbi:hypothetical protein Tco_1556968 [Tanacetum coccineum]